MCIRDRLVSQLTFFDYVMGITIGSIAATLSVDLESRAWPHWVGLAVWTIAVLAIQIASAKSNVAAKVFMGEPVVVISKGKLLEDAMGRMRYTAGNLLEQLRNQGIFDISTVEFAVMESDGQLSVLLKQMCIRDRRYSQMYIGGSLFHSLPGNIHYLSLIHI